MIRIRRATATALLVAVVWNGVPEPRPVGAADGTGACASHLVPATAFTDTIGSVHRAAIDCAVWWGLSNGTTATRFSPTRDISRGQAAAMLARLLRDSGHGSADVPSAGFLDVVGHTFEPDIDLLASLDIARGVTATRFEPDRPVARDQMSSWLVRTFEYGYAAPLPAGPMPFADVVGNVHADAIARVAAAGITTGTSPTTFEPHRPVPRAQMASFLARSMEVLLSQGLVGLPATRPQAGDAYHSRMRAAWVHLFDPQLKTRAGIEALVEELAAADANAVIAQVARRHDAYYASDVLPQTPDPALAPGLDVLTELLEQAHLRGIEVHAWFGVGPTWHEVYDGLVPPPGWMHTEHGIVAAPDQRWVTRTYDGAWSTYLDPGVAGVQDHAAAVVGELADRYDLDGIHLDYVRYESASHGYNPIALSRYRAETGAVGTPRPDDPAWAAWRREQTRRIMLRARRAIEASGREVTLSAAVITWLDAPATPDRAGFQRTSPYTRVLQDWDGWVRRGEVDVAIPMNYFRAHDPEQARSFAQWIAYEQALGATTAVDVVPGPAGYLNQPSNVLSQVRNAMTIDGSSIYSYQQPTNDGTRNVWEQLAATRWQYRPTR